MSAVAIPPVAPAQPAAPAPHVPTTVHNREDAIANRVAAAMLARSAAAPPAQAAPIVAQPIPATPVTPALPAVAAPIITAPAEINLEELDFDAPPPIEAKPADLVPATPTTPALTSDSQLETELAQLLKDGAVPEKIEEVFLKHSRGRQMLGSYKTLRDLALPPAEDGSGGIGRIPTIDEIKQADSAYREIGLIRHEIDNDPRNFARNLFVVNPENGRSWIGDPAQIQAIAAQIPQALFDGIAQNPQVYAPILASVTTPFFQNLLNHQYQVALALPDQVRGLMQDGTVGMVANEDKARLLDAWQIAELTLFGKPRPLQLGRANGNGNGSRMDEPQVNQELLDLRARTAQYERQIQDSNRQNFETRVHSVQSAAKSSAMADIETALAATGVKQVYSDLLLEPQRQAIYNDINASLERSNPTGWARYQMDLQKAARGQVSADQPANTYRQLFRNALKSSEPVRQRLNELVKSGQQNSQDQNARRSQSQLRTEPAGGQAAPGSVLPAQQIVRQPGESTADIIQRRLAATMMAKASVRR